MRTGLQMLAAFTCLALGSATSALAEIDFGSMPKGCSWTIKYSGGQVLTETYLGAKSGKHVTRVTEGKSFVRQTTYDGEGRMVRKDWADGNWETFSPYSCFDAKGSCTYRYKNSDGASQKIASKTVASGEGFAVRAGPVGGERYPDEYFETGAFGLMTRNKASNYSARMTGMKNCGVGS
jgi:YD repeat-containing protein